MTPRDITLRRLEIGLTCDELAFALHIQPAEMRKIEAGESEHYLTEEFQEAFAALEERVFGLMVGV